MHVKSTVTANMSVKIDIIGLCVHCILVLNVGLEVSLYVGWGCSLIDIILILLTYTLTDSY